MTRRKKNGNLFFLLVAFTKRKKSLNTIFLSLSLSGEKKYFEDNFYINIHELKNINISTDGHPITFVSASGGPGSVRRD